MHLTLNAPSGTDFAATIKEAIKIAQVQGLIVEFTFNEQTVTVKPKDSVEDIKTKYFSHLIKTGAELIASERTRQISEEEFTWNHDDQYVEQQLVKAAICYAKPDDSGWPWDMEWWKPTTTIRNLTKAGALIAAEIDRLQRIQRKSQ